MATLVRSSVWIVLVRLPLALLSLAILSATLSSTLGVAGGVTRGIACRAVALGIITIVVIASAGAPIVPKLTSFYI